MLGHILDFTFSGLPKISTLNSNESRMSCIQSILLSTEVYSILQPRFVEDFCQTMLGIYNHKRSKSISEDFFELFKKSNLSKQYPCLNHHILEIMCIQDLFGRLLELVRLLEDISIPIIEFYSKSILFKKIVADDVNFDLKLLEYDGGCLRKIIIHTLTFLFSSMINKQVENLHKGMFGGVFYGSIRDKPTLRLCFDLWDLRNLASSYLKDKGINSQELEDVLLFLSTSLLDGHARKLEFFAGREHNSEKLIPIGYNFYMASYGYILRPFTVEDLSANVGYIGKFEYQKRSGYRGVIALYSEPNNRITSQDGFELDLSRVLEWGNALEILHGFDFPGSPHGLELQKLKEIVETFTSISCSSRYSIKS